jgi:hypothetical protein
MHGKETQYYVLEDWTSHGVQDLQFDQGRGWGGIDSGCRVFKCSLHMVCVFAIRLRTFQFQLNGSLLHSDMESSVSQLTMSDNEVARALFEHFQETPEERIQTTAFTRLPNRRICGSRRCFSSGVLTTSLLTKFSVIESCMPVRRC